MVKKADVTICLKKEITHLENSGKVKRMNSLCCVCWSVIGIVIVNLHTFVLDSLLSLVDILEH